MDLVKLKAVKDKLTLTLTKDVKIVVHADRVCLICFFLFLFLFLFFGGSLCFNFTHSSE